MALVSGSKMEGEEKAMSLPQLQSLMKKDPSAYETEFDQQWKHFNSMMEVFKLKPQKPNSNFGEQVMFLAHVAPSFPEKSDQLPSLIISVLDEHYEVMHALMRQTLVQALFLLRNRNQFPCMRTLPLYFKLFNSADKGLRTQIFSHIVRDIGQQNLKQKNQKANKELRDLFFLKLKDGEPEVSRRACALFIALYRKNIWRDSGAVNLMSAALVHPDVKIAAALAHLFLGNKTKGLDGILEESDNEEDNDATDVVHKIVGAKKTPKREKRLKRAKAAAEKAKTKKRTKAEGAANIDFIALDLLHDPQTLAEKLLQRISKTGEPFQFRMLLLHLIARLVSRHQLLMPNLYPYMLKYLQPQQKDVTQVLACLVEACHHQVPPDDIRPVVLHVMNSFVTEVQAPEVIEVGLNGIREVCARSVNVLTEDELGDLCGFRKFKNKGVQMACKSLINTYREIDPNLLHRSLRGRQASMALSRGEVKAPQYGTATVFETIDGLDLLLQKKKKRKTTKDGDDDSASASGNEAATAEDRAKLEAEGKSMLQDQVLSSDDFKRLRKLRLQRSIELQLGRKQKAEEMDSSSSEHDSDEDSEDASDGERGLVGRVADGVAGADLKATKKRSKTKASKLEIVKAGRVDMKAKIKEKGKQRKGGKTNAENRRNKPQLMQMDSFRVRKKKAANAHEKIQNMKSHIKTMKKNKNHQKIRRR